MTASEAAVSRSRTEVTAYVGIVASVVAAALVLAPSWHGSALVGALVLACVPAGAARHVLGRQRRGLRSGWA